MNEKNRVSMQDLAPAILQALSSGGNAEITITGRSMMPLFIDRVSRVRLTEIKNPKRGNIVLYRRQSGSYVLHRIVKCNSDGTFSMCGDGQTEIEPDIRREQLLAIVTDYNRRGKWRGCDGTVYTVWWKLHLADRTLRHQYKRAKNLVKRMLKKL